MRVPGRVESAGDRNVKFAGGFATDCGDAEAPVPAGNDSRAASFTGKV